MSTTNTMVSTGVLWKDGKKFDASGDHGSPVDSDRHRQGHPGLGQGPGRANRRQRHSAGRARRRMEPTVTFKATPVSVKETTTKVVTPAGAPSSPSPT